MREYKTPKPFADDMIPLRFHERGPEPIRAINRGGRYLVQTWNKKRGTWITQAEHTGAKAAIEDADSWYVACPNRRKT